VVTVSPYLLQKNSIPSNTITTQHSICMQIDYTRFSMSYHGSQRSPARVGHDVLHDPFSAERDAVLDVLRGATQHVTSLHMVFDVAIAHPHDPVIHAAVFEALSGMKRTSFSCSTLRNNNSILVLQEWRATKT
jgi:hypothetical protein